MGRAKLPLVPITKERSKKITYQKRKAGLFKKAYEFSTLCGVDACVIAYGPQPKKSHRPSPAETWPENPEEVRRIINKSTGSNGKNSQDLTHFFVHRKRKIDREIMKQRKKNWSLEYTTWDGRFDAMPENDLRRVLGIVEGRLEVAARMKATKIGEIELANLNKMINARGFDGVARFGYVPSLNYFNSLEFYNTHPGPRPFQDEDEGEELNNVQIQPIQYVPSHEQAHEMNTVVGFDPHTCTLKNNFTSLLDYGGGGRGGDSKDVLASSSGNSLLGGGGGGGQAVASYGNSFQYYTSLLGGGGGGGQVEASSSTDNGNSFQYYFTPLLGDSGGGGHEAVASSSTSNSFQYYITHVLGGSGGGHEAVASSSNNFQYYTPGLGGGGGEACNKFQYYNNTASVLGGSGGGGAINDNSFQYYTPVLGGGGGDVSSNGNSFQYQIAPSNDLLHYENMLEHAMFNQEGQ